MSKQITGVRQVKTLVGIAPINFAEKAQAIDLPWIEEIRGDNVSFVIDFEDIMTIEGESEFAQELRQIVIDYKKDGFTQIILDVM